MDDIADSSQLLALPAELRLQIFEYIIADDQLHNPWHSLLLTSKLTNGDMTSLLSKATFRYRIAPLTFHAALATRVKLKELQAVQESTHVVLVNFQEYCRRFNKAIFDITAVRQVAVCRLPPTYEANATRTGNWVVDRMATALRTADNKSTAEVRWGSYSRNVHRNTVTWDTCVLREVGGLLLFHKSDADELLECAIVMEDRHRKGLEPLFTTPLNVHLSANAAPQIEAVRQASGRVAERSLYGRLSGRKIFGISMGTSS